ncbi:MAG: hypothetical protein NT030_01805 [Candidatus Saganbacteria bacterium]|nr:hypothetical protein [Candidatus Saganbacteria bacterium]
MAYIPFCPRLSYDLKSPIKLWVRQPIVHNFLSLLRKKTVATQYIDCLGQSIKIIYSSPSFEIAILAKKDVLYIATNRNSYLFDPKTFKIDAYSSKNGRFYRVFSPTYYEELLNHFSMGLKDAINSLTSSSSNNLLRRVFEGKERKEYEEQKRTLYFLLNDIRSSMTRSFGLPISRLE